MKKLLITSAILAVSAGTAHAQSSVTLFGLIDASYENVKAGDYKNGGRLSSGVLAGSRWGLRGNEDLGDGLKATFLLEGGFNIDDGTTGQSSRLFGRQAYAGLSGSFGEIRLGRQYSPIGALNDKLSYFGTTYGVVGIANDNSNDSGGFYRQDNTFTYISPSFTGAKVQLAYSSGTNNAEGLTDNDRKLGRAFGVLVDYSNGPLYVGVAHSTLNFNQTGPETFKRKATLVGGSYDFGVVKLALGYTRDKAEDAPGGSDLDFKAYTADLAIPVGKGEFNVAYGRKNVDRINGVNAEDRDVRVFNVGYKHNLSKRTTLYAAYTKISNDDASAKTFAGIDSNGSASGGSIVAGEDPRGLAIGLRHSF